MFPIEAKSIACVALMPFESATIKAASEEKGRIVAALKAAKKRANSAILYSRLLKL